FLRAKRCPLCISSEAELSRENTLLCICACERLPLPSFVKSACLLLNDRAKFARYLMHLCNNKQNDLHFNGRCKFLFHRRHIRSTISINIVLLVGDMGRWIAFKHERLLSGEFGRLKQRKKRA